MPRASGLSRAKGLEADPTRIIPEWAGRSIRQVAPLQSALIVVEDLDFLRVCDAFPEADLPEGERPDDPDDARFGAEHGWRDESFRLFFVQKSHLNEKVSRRGFVGVWDLIYQ
jgi:hypothetical protein